MSPSEQLHHKISARDAANRLLGRLTVGAVLGAVAGVGIFGYVSAETIPGSSTPSTTTASTVTSSSSGSSQSTASTSTDGGISTGSVGSSSSGSAVAVTGGS